jgi:4'-phosphopantetheinyl transferase
MPRLEPDASAWQADLSVQEQHWCRGLAPAVRGRYIVSRVLLRQRLGDLLGMEAAAVPLHSPPGQPPLLGLGAGFISLSHSGSGLLLAWSAQPIGVDLEWGQRPLLAEALAQRFFPVQECVQIQAMPAAVRERAVLESWVRKEAAIKWRRSSLATDLRHWQWDHQHHQLRHRLDGLTPPCRLVEREGWLCATVGVAVAGAIWG